MKLILATCLVIFSVVTSAPTELPPASIVGQQASVSTDGTSTTTAAVGTTAPTNKPPPAIVSEKQSSGLNGSFNGISEQVQGSSVVASKPTELPPAPVVGKQAPISTDVNLTGRNAGGASAPTNKPPLAIVSEKQSSGLNGSFNGISEQVQVSSVVASVPTDLPPAAVVGKQAPINTDVTLTGRNAGEVSAPSNKPPPAIVSQEQSVGLDGSFNSKFETENGISEQVQGSLKKIDDKTFVQVIQGNVSWTAPDGTPVRISWIADENGYRPQSDSIPTAPSIPAEIQKSLDYNAAHPETTEAPKA